ncbi:uracil-DNA glycosylase [Sulfurovum sp. zt1-1]|uniref:Uracil-DNA glycosylase n=1 Tax=Sulfurovum zhangzhouensis TaxID=3019067 RepID=A0ABT7QWJ8_9BACT|nr:uracil-DNA glycosylase [Sulfurovum zhangzhouensis]MDM5271219.1 uracil-DNA glycosylase [Sulfurovum zhangzhouensis]
MLHTITLDPSWQKALSEEFEKPYMHKLKAFLDEEIAQQKQVLPQTSYWFNALNSTPLDQVKVVILGQDPYPTAGHAHGLAFSVMPEVKPLPKSLQNINQELYDDLGIDNSHTGYLQSWAKQGVLLLNAVLTVEAGKSNAHQGKGWEMFTQKVVDIINEHSENVVFILWGNYAQKKGASIDTTRHLVIKTPHPSPLSAYRGFFGSKPFSQVNEYLKLHNITEIDWRV